MPNKHIIKKQKDKQLAKSEIEKLMSSAKDSFKTDKAKANNFVKKARRLAMKHKIRLAPTIKRRFCKYCYSFFVPGINCRIRTRDAKIVVYCSECKKFARYTIIKRTKP